MNHADDFWLGPLMESGKKGQSVRNPALVSQNTAVARERSTVQARKSLLANDTLITHPLDQGSQHECCLSLRSLSTSIAAHLDPQQITAAST